MRTEHSACGVGFVASLKASAEHRHLQLALQALRCVEHRGACAADGRSGDGSGVMTDIPWDVLGYPPGSVAVATLFLTPDTRRRRAAIAIWLPNSKSARKRAWFTMNGNSNSAMH